MSNVCVYSFADASGVTKYVDSVGDYYYNGTWSASGTYLATPLNAVGYGAAQYMCIRDNIGDNPQRVPTRTRPQSWSIMSLLYEYQCTGTTSGTDALAQAAWELAQTGTNIAWAAYYLAQIGTNTGSAAYDLAGSAYTVGTDAYNLAGYALYVADSAYTLAQIGTNTGSAALDAAAAAQSTANGAFSIAVAGTNAAATAQSTADAAWALAQIGTNTGTAALALATAGSNLAWDAYLLASSIGTDAVDLTARSTADSAYSIAVIGTNAAATAQSVADFAYYLAQIGTNTGTAAYDLAQLAYNTAISASGSASGSVALDAYHLAETGTNIGWAAYYLAQIGTNTGTAAFELAGSAYTLAGHKAASMILCSAFTPASTGADAAEVPVPHAFDGSVISWNANRFTIRVQTAGSMPSAAIEKSEGDGGFVATSLGTVTLAMNAYEGSYIPSSGTVNSGDKLRFNVLDLGTAQNWTVAVELGV